eukprot:11966211-Ditylum_brightwellii.AAC.1
MSITTQSLYELLNLHLYDKVDEAAVIKAAQKNPEEVDRTFNYEYYSFGNRWEVCPLHQAIHLEVSID